MKRAFVALLLASCWETQPTPPATTPQPATAMKKPTDVCLAIARDIEKLGGSFPQLATFRASSNSGPTCKIGHDWHTHPPTVRGGWSGSTPEPDPDGIWFYIGLYDPNGPDAQSQIHTQPVVPNWWIGDRRVMVLMKEGSATKTVGGELMKILEKHGLETR